MVGHTQRIESRVFDLKQRLYSLRNALAESSVGSRVDWWENGW